MACAVGAVACVASVVAHWPHQYPLHRSGWEDDLFADLAPADIAPAPSSIVQADNTATSLDEESPQTLLVGQDLTPAEPMPDPIVSVLATPIGQRPVDLQPCFIQPVLHEITPDTRSVWLSGAIEFPPAESADSEATTQYFPSAQSR